MTVHKNYDKSDNDTYVERLGKLPYQDVHLHMFRDANGFIVLDNVKGNFTAETLADAQNRVLRFPSPADCGLIKIRDIKAHTIYPMSLAERYEIDEDDLAYAQRMPVYFDQKLNAYVLFMDTRFLRDMNFNDLFPHLADSQFVSRIQPYSSVRGARSFLGICFADLSEIKSASDYIRDQGHQTPLRALYDAYVKYRQSSAEREKVIFVRYEANSLVHDLFNLPFSISALRSRSFRVDYSVGFRVGDRYHLADENGEICQDKVISIPTDRKGFLILKHTEDQMLLLDDIDKAVDNFSIKLISYLDQLKSIDSDNDRKLIDNEAATG